MRPQIGKEGAHLTGFDVRQGTLTVGATEGWNDKGGDHYTGYLLVQLLCRGNY